MGLFSSLGLGRKGKAGCSKPFQPPTWETTAGQPENLGLLHVDSVVILGLNQHLLPPGIDQDFLFQILNLGTF
jgi:hypothetical protein